MSSFDCVCKPDNSEHLLGNDAVAGCGLIIIKISFDKPRVQFALLELTFKNLDFVVVFPSIFKSAVIVALVVVSLFVDGLKVKFDEASKSPAFLNCISVFEPWALGMVRVFSTKSCIKELLFLMSWRYHKTEKYEFQPMGQLRLNIRTDLKPPCCDVLIQNLY